MCEGGGDVSEVHQAAEGRLKAAPEKELSNIFPKAIKLLSRKEKLRFEAFP